RGKASLVGRILTAIFRGATGIGAGAGCAGRFEAIDAARTLAYDAARRNFAFLASLRRSSAQMKCSLRLLGLAAVVLLGANFCLAQQQAPQAEKPAEKPKEEKKPAVPEEKIVQTKHSFK